MCPGIIDPERSGVCVEPVDLVDAAKSMSKVSDELKRSSVLLVGTNDREAEGPVSPAEMGESSHFECMLDRSDACVVVCGLSAKRGGLGGGGMR